MPKGFFPGPGEFKIQISFNLPEAVQDNEKEKDKDK
jgi:hypothetical protein